MTLQFVSGALKNCGRFSRALHDGVGPKKGLHNTDMVGIVDSMGRTRSKLSASDGERNGMTRVGPSTDVLHQVSRVGFDGTAVTEPPLETKSGFVMSDPNSSMWNLCKDNKDAETTTKKISRRIIKMKDNIKQYYFDRLEENVGMFTEVEEPLRIGKIIRKERPMQSARDEELESDEVQSYSKAKKAQRMFTQLQNNSESENKSGQEEVYSSESQPKGYKKFNKLEYKKSSVERDDITERDFAEARANRMSKNDERIFLDQERPMVPSMWKRPSAKPEKETKENRGEGGFSDVVGMSPPVHFKYPKVGLRSRGLLDSLKSGDLVSTGFYRERLSDSRNYSTLMKNAELYRVKKTGFDLYKPVPLILQRDIAYSYGNRFFEDKRILAHSMSTSASGKIIGRDPVTKDSCDPKIKLPRCTLSKDPPCCEKIVLCGCDPVNPKVNAVAGCEQGNMVPLLNMAKRPDYLCPSFSECFRRPEMGVVFARHHYKKECCVKKPPCVDFVGPMRKRPSVVERQEKVLMQKYWSAQKTAECRCYHTSVRSLFGSSVPVLIGRQTQVASFHCSAGLAEEEKCDKPENNKLPCIKTVTFPGQKKKEKGKGSCEKLCMPCCEPARDPPECMQLIDKSPCKKFRNPRPSFSECRKKFPFRHVKCECEVVAKPSCDKRKDKEPVC